MTELEIIQLCKERSPKGQKELVHQYSQVLMGLIFRYTLSKDDSKDILQDSFIQVFQKIDLYDASKGKFGPWLKSVTVKMVLMHLRKKKSTFSNQEKYTNHQERNAAYKFVDTSLEEKDLYRMIFMLPDQQRLVFNLSAIEGYSHKEISQKLGIKESYSRTILTRARTLLKKFYEKKYDHKMSSYERF